MVAKVLYHPRAFPETPPTADTAVAQPRQSASAPATVSTSPAESAPVVSARGVDVGELYPDMAGATSAFAAAVNLLNESLQILATAGDAFDREPLEADDHINAFSALVLELFACRSLGEGFGNIVNA